MTDTCSNCKYSITTTHADYYLLCRRYPPAYSGDTVYLSSGVNDPRFLNVRVGLYDWCGEYAHSEGVINNTVMQVLD